MMGCKTPLPVQLKRGQIIKIQINLLLFNALFVVTRIHSLQKEVTSGKDNPKEMAEGSALFRGVVEQYNLIILLWRS